MKRSRIPVFAFHIRHCNYGFITSYTTATAPEGRRSEPCLRCFIIIAGFAALVVDFLAAAAAAAVDRVVLTHKECHKFLPSAMR